MEKLKQEMKREAMAYNKCLDNDFFNNKTLIQILPFVHPTSRIGYHERIKNKRNEA